MKKRIGYENMTKSALIAALNVKDELLKGKDLRNKEFFQTGFEEGHAKAVVETNEVIRHMNSQITGYKEAITKKDNVIATQNSQIVELAKVVDMVPELLEKMERILHANNELKKENKKEKEMREEAEEVAYAALEEVQEKDEVIKNQDAKIKDLEKRLHLVSILADTDKDLPKGVK